MRYWFLVFCLMGNPTAAMAQFEPGRSAPEARMAGLQEALNQVLKQARSATVCIDLAEQSGSGVIVSADGLVLTAAHVVGRVDRDLTVVLENGRRLPAVSLGLVASSDAAMVRILDKGPFPFVPLGETPAPRAGDWVLAFGYPGGFEKGKGAIARLGRLSKIARRTLRSESVLTGGDSGGPLFNLEGTLLGIHSRVRSRSEESVHVTMSEYRTHWEALLRAEFVGEGPFARKPVKGSGFLGLATEAWPERGLRVIKVGRESPAERAGIREGDILLRLNAFALQTPEQFLAILQEMAAGDRLEIELQRDKKPSVLRFRLGER